MAEIKSISRACFFRSLCLSAGALCAYSDADAENKSVEKFHLLENPRHKRDWNDKRSRKVVFLAHCIANMNARMHRCSQVFAASAAPLVRFCLDHELGMAVMPCPELLVTGLGRDRDEPEKEYLRQALEEPLARQRIRELARQVVFQMNEYRFQGFEMVAMLGNDGSPSCGVNRTSWPDPAKRFGPGRGVFIEELRALMAEAGIELPMMGIEDERIEESVSRLEKTISN